MKKRDKDIYKILILIFIILMFENSILNGGIKIDFSKYYDINHHKISTITKKTLVIFVNTKFLAHRVALFYTKIVEEKYKKIKDFSVIGIISDDNKRETVNKIIKDYGINFPIIYDESKEIFNNIGICSNCGGIVFLRDGIIKQLISPINTNDYIRKIVEWELFRKVSDQEYLVFENKIAMGASIKWLKVREPYHRKFFKFIPTKISVVTFFSSLCGLCKTGKRLKTLRFLKNKLPETHIINVLLNPLREEDIVFLKKYNLKFTGKLFFSHNFFSNEELYLTNTRIKKDPYSIIVNKRGRIIYVENLADSERILLRKIIKVLKKGGKSG